MDKPTATDKVEAVDALGNPELHVGLGLSRSRDIATNGTSILTKVRADQIPAP